MSVEELLDLLEAVRETGPSRWKARCPAHDDKTPSLAIRDVDDMILLQCFAECSTHDIVSAVGRDLSDLFPDKPRSHKPISKPFPAQDVLRCLSNEFSVVMLVASDLAKDGNLNSETKERLLQSAARFQSALSAGGLT